MIIADRETFFQLLPVLPSCNRCGECCKVGGPCVLRMFDQFGTGARSPHFKGRCDMLMDEPDGTTRCKILSQMSDSERSQLINGSCTFPNLRREITHPENN